MSTCDVPTACGSTDASTTTLLPSTLSPSARTVFTPPATAFLTTSLRSSPFFFSNLSPSEESAVILSP